MDTRQLDESMACVRRLNMKKDNFLKTGKGTSILLSKFLNTHPVLPRWMEDHNDNLEDEDEEDCLCNTLDVKDAHLSNLEEDFLFELMLAANFLHVTELLDALAKVF